MKEMTPEKIADIKEGLNTKKIIGLVIPDTGYDESLMKIVKTISKGHKILYISVNKTCGSLINKFKQNKIDMDSLYIIDCITRTERDVLPTKNCIYVSSPRALDEIQTAILSSLRKQEIDVVLLDSPSSLMMYYEHMDVLQFMHRLMTVLIIADCKGIFPFPKESTGPLRRSIEMFTNKIFTLEHTRGSSS